LISLPALPRPTLALAMLAVGIASWYLVSSPNDKPAGEPAAKAHVPSYFVRDLDMVSMGFDGLPERHIETIKMTEFFDDETTEMEKPFYTFFREDTPPWKIHAEQGWLSADGELALLSGRVTMEREASLTSLPLKMVTTDVRIQPSSNYLETDNHVKITSNDDVVTAVGMQAWLTEPGRVKFLSNVRAHYEIRR
jgi:lipopolysaccharide export system protein LptC